MTDSTIQPSLNKNKPVEKLKEFKFNNRKNLTFSYLDIKSVKNKFDSLQEIVMGKVHISIVAETKIDPSFPTAHCLAEWYHNTAQKMKFSINNFLGKCDQVSAGNCRFCHIY